MFKAIIFDCFGVFYPDPVFTYMRDPKTSPEKANALHTLDVLAAYGDLAKLDFIDKAARLLGTTRQETEQRFLQGTERNHTKLRMSPATYAAGLIRRRSLDKVSGKSRG